MCARFRVNGAWRASPKKIASDEESGRGLMLMEILSKDHGVHRKAEGTKVV
jgi:hypothetical protein